MGERGVPYYVRKKFVDASSKMLIDLFDKKLVVFEEKFTRDEIDQGKKFFVENKKDLKKELNLQKEKESIPEDNDIKLIVCSSKMGWTCPYILSNDSHFIGYQDEIHAQFKISILELEELRQIMKMWNWIS